jgi:hypothetical protein
VDTFKDDVNGFSSILAFWLFSSSIQPSPKASKYEAKVFFTFEMEGDSQHNLFTSLQSGFFL